MSEEAGAPGSDDGVALVGVKFAPLAGLKLDLSEQYGINTFNTVFLQADYTHPLAEDLRLIFGGQFTDQRAVGDQLLTNASSKDWSTYNVSAKAAVAYRELTVTLGGSITGDGHTIQAPWGSFPGYLSLIQEDFQRANEKAILVGVAYDFSKLITPGARRVRQHRLRLGRDRPEDPRGRAGPDRVRPHDRLPAAQRVPPAPDDAESLVPAARRHSRPGECRPARLAGSIHRELGDPDLCRTAGPFPHLTSDQNGIGRHRRSGPGTDPRPGRVEGALG